MSKQIQIYVDDEYFDLVPRPTKEQRKTLKESMQREGQLEPIIVDSSGRIIDGHTRFELCEELHLKPKFIIRDFTDEDSKKSYAITVNLQRRHLNDYQIFELVQKEYEIIREKNEIERRKKISEIAQDKRIPETEREYTRNKAIKQLSQLTGVKTQTLEQCKVIKESGDSKIQKQVREGITTPREAYLKLKKLGKTVRREPARYRSRLGVVFDILRVIKNSDKDVRPTYLYRMANLSFSEGQTLFEILIDNGIIKQTTKTQNYRHNYRNTEFDFKVMLMTEKGNELYEKLKSLHEYLPKELQI